MKFGQFWIQTLKAEPRRSHNINNINTTSALHSFESTPLRGLAAGAKPGGSQTNAAVNSLSAAKLWVCGDPHPRGFTPSKQLNSKAACADEPPSRCWIETEWALQESVSFRIFLWYKVNNVDSLGSYDNGLVSFFCAPCWDQGWCKKNLNQDKLVPSEAIKHKMNPLNVSSSHITAVSILSSCCFPFNPRNHQD